ncbi:site-specific integrase [Nitrospirillum bahiense]|uniref:Site-specific recombinase XerD n=1 Tax=Nitrospirillum amazonense TaxID=28077 RepID=A0A560FC83_9PROT|nr:site-specific integrase [Nitrospirillum amazonense]TWB19221.1 site-specific recombinase XerD [Nitrospirillum amazonense]
MQAKITKKLVDQVQPGHVDIVIFDTVLKGFLLKVTPKGTKTYLVRYRMGGRATPLQKFTIGRHGSPWTPETARTEAERLLGRVRLGGNPVEEKRARLVQAFTVADLADRYLLQHAGTKNKPSTVAEATRLVEKVIKPELGARAVESITRADVATLHHKFRETPRQANHVLAVLSKMMALAEVWGFRPDASNPCRAIERYKEVKRERFLSVEEIARLGEAINARQEAYGASSSLSAITLLLLTGMRVGEAVALRWEDVQLGEGMLVIRDAKAGGRRHPIGAAAVDFLSGLERTGPWVLMSRETDTHIGVIAVDVMWRKLRKEAGLEDARVHDLRHTVGTFAGQTGANAFLVRDKLGHKTLAMTGRYVSKDANPLRELSDKVEGRIMGALKAGGKVEGRG